MSGSSVTALSASSRSAKAPKLGARTVCLTGPTGAATASKNVFGPSQPPWGDYPHVQTNGIWSPGIPNVPTKIVTPPLRLLRAHQNAQ